MKETTIAPVRNAVDSDNPSSGKPPNKVKKIVLYVLLAIVSLTYFCIRLPALRYSFSIGTTAPYDFPQDYIAGTQLLAGKSVYPSHYMDLYTSLLLSSGVNVDTRIMHINAHPPFAALLLFPLWFLSFHNALFLYGLITIACMFLTIFLLIKAEDISWVYFPLISLFTFAWLPFQANLSVGQISILATLFVITGWYFLRKDREEMSGIFIALATMLKFYPGLLMLYFLINKRYKAFLYSVLSITIILVLTVIVTKYDFFHFLFQILPDDSRYSGADIGNLSINGFFAKLFLSVKAYIGTGVFAASENYLLKDISLSATILVLLLYLFLHIKTYSDELGFSFFIILSLLLSPICWNHYLTLLLLPFVVLIKELVKRKNTIEIVIFLTSLFLISIDTNSIYFQKVINIVHFFVSGAPESFFFRMTFYSAPFYGMALLLFLNLRMIKKPAIGMK